MKTDNSRFYEERYQEGYNKRCNEIVHANLICVEGELYELTDNERTHFEELYNKGKGNDFEAKQFRAIALDYIAINCYCINTATRCYNY